MSRKLDDLLQTARDRFKLAKEATQKQYERELEDLKFQVPEEQWTEEARRARVGDEYSPGRPTLSISKIDQPLQLVLNEAKNARLGVDVHPVNEDADDDTAEVLQGIYRRIERDSNASDARMWAFDRALKCGRGFYRVTTKYDEDVPDTWDQEISIERILYQSGVYLDPAAIKPDWSDGEFGFVATWLSRRTFEMMFPKARLSLGGEGEWKRTAQEDPEWVSAEPGREGALVIEYWYKEHQYETIEAEFDGEKRKRTRDNISVYCAKINGTEVVEEPVLWPGQYIPIIPVCGREIQPYDDVRRFFGMIHPAKDAQRFFNFAASSLVERMSLEPKAPYVGFTGQFEGHEDKWNRANQVNYPYLEVNPITADGKPVPAPQRSEVNTRGMSVAMAALQEADQFIHGTMQAGYAPDIGKFPARERSGRAIKALQDQLETGTSNYIGDLARNSMGYEAKVVLDLIPKIYDRPGRVTQVLGAEGDSKAVMVGLPFVRHQDTGRPIEAPVDPAGRLSPNAKTYDFGAGRYTVTVSVGRSHETRMREGRDEMSRLLESQGELWPVLGPTFMKYLDSPWAQEAADLLLKFRNKKFPELAQGDDDEEMTPEATRAKLDAAEAHIERLTNELKESKRALETDQAKQQASMQNAQLKALTDLKKTEMQNLAKIVEQMMEQRFEAFERRIDRAFEARQKAAEAVQKVEEKAADITFGPAQGPLTTDDTIR